MKNIWNWIKNNPNRAMFLVPILLVAGISISHVVTWYDMTNPINWAIYLSVAIEVGAITALVAATNRIKGGIWFMFGIVTFIQMVGNIFYSYNEIDANGELFKSWVELTGPIWELMGTELTDIVGMKRWLAFLEGGLLPIISLTSLHFFVKYEKPKTEENPSSVKNTQVETEGVWEKVKELKKSDKLSEPTEKDIEREPTALANSQYINEEEWDEDHALDMVINDMVDSLSEEEINEQPVLVEEENPEDEILGTQVLVEKKINEQVIEKVKNFENETSEEMEKSTQIINAGEELNRTWNNIIKTRKVNNGITRLGE